MTDARTDIGSRDDVTRLVDAFYHEVQADHLLGPIFTDVARVEWSEHLPKMYDFWEAVLFGRPGPTVDPLAVHRLLARRTALTRVEFDRWVALFHASVDRLFRGAVADLAKLRAVRIAAVMQQHIVVDQLGR